MKAPISTATSIQDILSQHPALVQVFTHHHMDCVGCWLQRFCTLEDAALSYALQPNDLLEEIQRKIPQPRGD